MTPRPNHFVAVVADDAAHLTYAAQVHPSPLTVSVPGREATLGSLEVVLTNQTESVLEIESVTFSIEVGAPGPDGPTLTPTTSGIKAIVDNTVTWSFTGPSSPVTSGTADYVLAPVVGTGSLAAGASVVVEIYDFQTVEQPGTTTVNAKEIIGDADPVFTPIQISTFPDGFYFDGLVPTVRDGSSLVAVAQVDRGKTVTLTWNSSVVATAAQQVLYSSATGQQVGLPSVLGEWTSPRLDSDTVFAVSVTATGEGDEPLVATLMTQVSVGSPALTAASLDVGTLTVRTEVTGPLKANDISATGITVDGVSTLNGSLSVHDVKAEGITLDGDTTTTGTATVGGMTTLNGGLTSLGTSGFDVLNATAATVSGSLGALGATVSAINSQPQPLELGATYRAKTDGFLVGFVDAPKDKYRRKLCITTLTLYANDIRAPLLGGNITAYDGDKKLYYCPSANSSMLPVSAGTRFGTYVDYSSKTPAEVKAHWIPLGKVAGSYEKIGAQAAPEHAAIIVAADDPAD